MGARGPHVVAVRSSIGRQDGLLPVARSLDQVRPFPTRPPGVALTGTEQPGQNRTIKCSGSEFLKLVGCYLVYLNNREIEEG